jgi:lysozyme
MRQVGELGLTLIEGFEQFRAHPYQDAVGIWTIGYGAIWGLDGLRVTAAHPPIAEAQAQEMLRRDTRKAAAAVSRLVRPDIEPCQFDALASFAFNLGGGALQASTLRRVINRGEDPPEICWTSWNKAGGRVLAGLTRRRLAERQLYQAA